MTRVELSEHAPLLSRGYPAALLCDNGPELACDAMADWAGERVGLSFIPPGEPWRNGYVESFNGPVRSECLNINIFWSPRAGSRGDHRLEGRLQPLPTAQLARLSSASGLRCGLHPTDERLSYRVDQFSGAAN